GARPEEITPGGGGHPGDVVRVVVHIVVCLLHLPEAGQGKRLPGTIRLSARTGESRKDVGAVPPRPEEGTGGGEQEIRRRPWPLGSNALPRRGGLRRRGVFGRAEA